MCGKGNATTTQTTAPNPAAMSAYKSLLGTAGYAQEAAAPISGEDISRYMDPYTKQVVGATQAQFNQQNEMQRQALMGNAVAQHALGGDREALAESSLAGQQQMAQAPVIAGLYSKGYGQALQTALAEQQARMQGAYGLGQIGTAGQGAALQGAGAQVQAGTLEQQTQQNLDTQQKQEYYQALGYPFQVAQWLAGITTGVGSQMGGTSTTTGPPPNPWTQLAGLGIAGAGLAGGLGWKPFGARRGGRIN